VKYGKDLHVVVSFTHSYLGRFDARVEIIFEDTTLRSRFAIVRTVRVVVGDPADHQLLQPVAPFIPRKRTARDPETEVTPGERPPALKAIPWVVTLPKAEIPKAVSTILETGSVSHIVTRLQQSIMPMSLDSTTYGRHFKNLLWIEEHRSELVTPASHKFLADVIVVGLTCRYTTSQTLS
jgi:helicase MOV-10